MPSHGSPWLVSPRPVAGARAHFVLLPHAGASLPTFRGWEDRVPKGWELSVAHLPGRGMRMRETPVREPAVVVNALVEALRPKLHLPTVLVGHSLGAQVALSMVHRMRSEGLPMPKALVVSGRRGPRAQERMPPIHKLTQAPFLAELERRYGALDEALRHPELSAMLFPMIQADFQLSETWPIEAGPPLDLPIHARGGISDSRASLSDLETWRQETTGMFTVERMSGGHFYLVKNPEPFLASIRGVLQSVL